MDAKFSPRVKDVITYSREEALRLGHSYIGVEHLLLGIIREGEGTAIRILEGLHVDLERLRQTVENSIKTNKSATASQGNIPLVKQAEKILKITYLEAKIFKSAVIGTEHLLLSILKDEDNVATRALHAFNIDYDIAKEEFESILQDETGGDLGYPKSEFPSTDDEDDMPFSGGSSGGSGGSGRGSKKGDSKSKTPVLDNFGRDLTKMAEESKLDPIVGREKEIERVSQVLSRRKKNNPILIGEPGVGKSAIAEGLALRRAEESLACVVRQAHCDLGHRILGGRYKYRGQFEERESGHERTREVARSHPVHRRDPHHCGCRRCQAARWTLPTCSSPRSHVARSNASVPPPWMSTASTLRRTVLWSVVSKVIVEPTSMDETIQILHNIKDKYEAHHSVNYTDEAIEACVKLTSRYITDRHLPDKAIDALDEVGSRVHLNNINVPQEILDIEKEIEDVREEKNQVVRSQKYEEAAKLRDRERQLSEKLEDAKRRWEEESKHHRETVTIDHVEEIVAMMTGIPVQRNVAAKESDRLSSMESHLNDKVIGQPDAVVKTAKAIKRNRAGLKDPNKPIGSFIFLGPTGVGKTQLAKELAKFLFDSEEALIRIDMSEYMEKFAVSRLIGAPPGYVGYEEGGQLTEKVRRRPYSIVLLDEIEKAHPDVFNLLLQALDDGQMTDSLGRKIDFRNTIMIMTSNIGARQLQDFGTGVGFSTASRDQQEEDSRKGVIQSALKRAFAPEFLNRIDDIVVFNSLKREDIHEIIDIELAKLYNRVNTLGYTITLTEEAKDFIADKGYDQKFGARPLRRSIQKHLEDPLADEIINANVEEGDTIEVGFDKKKEEITVKVKKNKGGKSSKKQKPADEPDGEPDAGAAE